MKSLFLTLLLVVSFTLRCAASNAADAPQIVSAGLEAYKVYGLSAGMDVWLEGSPAGGADARAAVQAAFTQANGSYGRMVGYELAGTVALSPSVRRVYAVIRHEKGPLYAWFECYQSPTGWIIPQLDANP